MENSIRIERAKKRMTQQELADKLGVSRQTIFAIENGKQIPSTPLAMKIRKVFGCSFDELFKLEETD